MWIWDNFLKLYFGSFLNHGKHCAYPLLSATIAHQVCQSPESVF